MNERIPRGFEPKVLRLQPWKVWALAIVGGAAALAVMVAVAGVMLVLVPILLVAGLATKLLLRSSLRRAGARPTGAAPGVIEGRFEVLDGERERRPG